MSRMPKLKEGEIVITVKKMPAWRYPLTSLKDYTYIPEKTKLKIERITAEEEIPKMVYTYNGNIYYTRLNANETVRCKRLEHEPKECKHCKFYLKGCVI